MNAIDLYLFEELETDVEVEDGRYSNRAKEAHEDCLSLLFDLMNKLVHSEHNGETPMNISTSPSQETTSTQPEKQNQDTQKDEAVNRNNLIVRKH